MPLSLRIETKLVMMFWQLKASLKFIFANDLVTNYTKGKDPAVCAFWF